MYQVRYRCTVLHCPFEMARDPERYVPATAPALTAYLARLTPVGEREHVGREAVRMTSYLTDVLPPLEHVWAVRCVVLRGQSVLAMRTGDAAHVLPGGRREPGETLAQTLERELLEETGWTVTEPRQIGIVHLHWLIPREQTPQHASPSSLFYPDFLWLIYAAEAGAHHPEAMLHHPHEGLPEFLPLSNVTTASLLARRLALENRIFLAAALRRAN